MVRVTRGVRGGTSGYSRPGVSPPRPHSRPGTEGRVRQSQPSLRWWVFQSAPETGASGAATPTACDTWQSFQSAPETGASGGLGSASVASGDVVSIRSRDRSLGRARRRAPSDARRVGVSIRSRDRSLGRGTAPIARRQVARFQSAPETGASGGFRPCTGSTGSASFNPLPRPEPREGPSTHG